MLPIALALVTLAAAFLVRLFLSRGKGAGTAQSSSSPASNVSNTSNGTTTPAPAFAPPPPLPLTTITPLPLSPEDLTETKAIPYRPVRWNKFPIHMGIRSMPWDEWFQLDEDYPAFQAHRAERTRSHPYEVTDTLPGYHAAALEALCETASFLAARYPRLFTVERRTYDPKDERTWGDSFSAPRDGAVKAVRNLVTGEVWDFDAIEREKGPEWNPMEVAGQLTAEDLIVLTENEAGEYIFQAGHIAAQGHWRFRDKLGCTMHEIHTNGSVEVPGWRDVLRKSMEKYFRNMRVEKPVQRNNFTFQRSDTLVFGATRKDMAKVNPDWNADAAAQQSADDIYFRTERQTLRRLPRTGALYFSFRTYLTPILAIAKEPGVAGRMASQLRAWPDTVHEYNSSQRYFDPLLAFLDKAHAEDVAEGRVVLDEKGEEVREMQYPF